jgi:tetratricopeptide (TPR) repeat protein/predicted Ser/Thr protein kinase
MDSLRWEKIQNLFHEAAERPESERQAFLSTACRDDRELIAEVTLMLKADGRSASPDASILDRGLPNVAYQMVGGSLDPASFREFGPYRIQKLLGEGGMGVVWLAQREDAGNQVAIKFLPHAGLSPARRERFAREIKTLAKLKHPLIARLYDAGMLADGTPWFVMEFVEGVPLTEYLREQPRSIEARLRLFRSVCDAVQYAHGQEIIHRDLKPSNILVEQDGTPRLLDFGIARELQGLDEPSQQTRPALRFMSQDYAAPEWVRDGTVGLYTDVYSLGVILYEMLTDRLPGNSAGHPEKPSVAAPPAPRVSKSAWNDLDVLCLKAMHTDPNERYRSVEALIRDIDHYLKGEPLEARPDTLRYRAGKFVRRNRQVVLATSLAFALIAGLVVFFTLRLAKERNTAVAEAARTQRIQRFMLNLFGDGDKAAAPSNDLRVLTLLDRGVQEAAVLDSDPETQAELYRSLGRMYQMLGKFPKADQLLHLALERMKVALGPQNPKIAEILIELALLRSDQGQYKDAESMAQKAVEIASRHLPPTAPAVVRAKTALGRVLAERGPSDKAIALLEPLVKIPPSAEEGPNILLESIRALAYAELTAGQYEVSESMYRRALILDRQLYGRSHPRVAHELGDIASAEATLGRIKEAEGLYRESLEIYKAWYGQNHPDTVQTATTLAAMLIQEGKYAEADSLMQQVLTIQEQTYGKVHVYVAFALDTLGRLELARGNLAAAESYASRAIRIDETLYGDSDHRTAIAKAHLAQVFLAGKQDHRAEPLLREAVKALTERPRPGNMSVGMSQLLLGGVLLREKRYEEAEKYLSAAYTILATQPGIYAKRLQETRKDLAEVYDALHQTQKANEFRGQVPAPQTRAGLSPAKR